MTPPAGHGSTEERIEEIARAIRAGEVAAIPTDTVYGLAALPDDEAALRRLAALKGRPEDQPFAVLFDNIEAIRAAVEDPDALDALDPFWPGPLTAVVRVARVVGPRLRRARRHAAGHDRPAHARRPAGPRGDPRLRRRARGHQREPQRRAAGRGLASEAIAMFGDALPVLDGGPRRRPPSTVIDLTVRPPAVLREGPIDAAVALAALGA